MASAKERAYALPAVFGVTLVAIALAFRRLGDPDLGWHLATGRSIWAHGALPKVDDLAFTHEAIRYSVVLSDLLFFGVWRAGGLFGLQVLGALVAAALAVVLLRGAGPSPIRFVTVALALAALNAWLFVSPGELSLLLLAVTMALVLAHRSAPLARSSRVALYSLAPIHLVWGNVHGFVAIGAAIVVAYAAYRAACRLGHGRLGGLLPAADGEAAGQTAIAAVLVLVASCANPGGPRLLLGLRRFGEELGDVQEWAPPSPRLLLEHEPLGLAIVALGLLAMALGREPNGQRSPRAFDLAAVLSSVVLSFLVTRMISIAAVLVAPIAAARLAWTVRPRPLLIAACSSALIAPGALMLLVPVTSVGVGFEESLSPTDAAAFVEAAQPRGRMWNFWPFGGYLAWRLGPRYEVFMDGRNTLARSRELVDRANASSVNPQVFAELVGELDLEWAITSASPATSAGAAIARNPGWSMIYLDDVASVYVRRAGPNAGLAARGYRFLRHDTPPAEALGAAMRGGAAGAALAWDGELAAAQAPHSVRSAFFAACGAIGARDAARVRSSVARLRELGADASLVSAVAGAWGEIEAPR